MVKSTSKLEWIIVRLGQDMNWWVEETSDPIHWDVVDGLSILDPRQISHVIESSGHLIEYGFQLELVNKAFYKFRILEDLGKGRIRLGRVDFSLLEETEPMFALPDILDEERGPYADLVNQLTKSRVKMLNDLIEFEEHLTIEDLEDQIRDLHQEEYLEGKAIHVFDELNSIIEYVPHGYELEAEEEEVTAKPKDLEEEFPDLEEEESIEEDETMRWGDEEAAGSEGFSIFGEDGEPKIKEEEEDEDVAFVKKALKKSAKNSTKPINQTKSKEKKDMATKKAKKASPKTKSKAKPAKKKAKKK